MKYKGSFSHEMAQNGYLKSVTPHHQSIWAGILMLRLVTDNIIGYLTCFMFMEGELEMKIVPFWVNEHTQCFSWRLLTYSINISHSSWLKHTTWSL